MANFSKHLCPVNLVRFADSHIMLIKFNAT
jgi:hypothetical protein